MTYKLQLDTQAVKYLKRLPKNISHRIFRKLKETKHKPNRYWIRLEGRNDYKLRVGDYRVIADLQNTQKLIQVTKIGHRKTIYDK